jgi:hypothetical protein
MHVINTKASSGDTHGPAVNSPNTTPIRQRTVFFISGFDPRGAKYYYPLYRDEASTYSKVSGVPVSVSPCGQRQNGDAFWDLVADTPEGLVATRYEYLRWDDLIREHWNANPLKQIKDIVVTTIFNLRHGSLWKILKLSWPPFIALFAPFLFLCSLVLGTPLLFGLVFSAASASMETGAACALASALPVCWIIAGWWLQKKYRLLWAMRSFAFTAKQALGRLPGLENKLDQHARTLLDTITAAKDAEVLIVSHSSGSVMLALIMARALRIDPQLGQRGPVVSLLTLGHWMPMLGCLPQAQAFRDDLRLVATASNIDWLDFSAPPDGCCFALVDPIKGLGMSDVGIPEDRPKLLSPRFAEMFEPAAYARLRQDKLRLHLQYMMAGHKPAQYDYFAITTGSMTLAHRFKDQQSIKDFSQFRLFKSR